MYTIISIYDVENVKIFNGILIGDKDTHNYKNENSTHEWGYGIDVKSSKNVEITSMQISNMTGDGIAVSNLTVKGKNTKQVRTTENLKISNCNIYENRRQGISIICGENIDIYNNEIHDIKGTSPQAAIDLETNNDAMQKINNIRIYNNKIYNRFAIMTLLNIYNVDIFNNEIAGKIIIYETNEKVELFNNEINGGEILAKLPTQRPQSIRNSIIIEENKLNNSNINIYDTENIVVQNNILNNSTIYYKDCKNVKIENNKI